MAYLAFENLDKVFNMLSSPPFIANELKLDSEEDKANFNRLVYTSYQGDSLKLTAQCTCGKIKGDFRIGEFCDSCHTVCRPQYSGEIESLIWILPPEGISGFILPVIWHMLTVAYKQDNVNVIRWLCDPLYRIPLSKMPDKVKYLMDKGHQRGYKYFIEHFFEIIDDLTFTVSGKIPRRYKAIYEVIQRNKDKIFCSALPVPSKIALVLEKSNRDNYFDKSLFPAIDAVILASEMGHLPEDTPLARYENKMVNIIDKMSVFIKNFTTDLLTGKYGIFRKHYFASRLHFTARQVITSNHGVHNADELVIPWTAAVKLFLEHLRSKLLKPPYSMNFNDINDLLTYAANNYDPLIDKLLTEIIVDDSPWKGFPCLFSRPPILTRGSIQFFYITGFTKDPLVNTIKISPLVLVMPNADFDGDAMHITLILGKAHHDAFRVLAPAFTILDPDKPRTLSDAIKMPAPIISTINNWFLDGDIKLKEFMNNLKT